MNNIIKYFITAFLSIAIIMTIAVPRHISSSEAERLAQDYILQHMEDGDEFKIVRIAKWYRDVSGKVQISRQHIDDSYNTLEVSLPVGNESITADMEKSKEIYSENTGEKVGAIKNIIDYWNPRFLYYVIYLKNENSGGEIFLNVDSYTGFIGDDRVLWDR